MTFQQRMAAHLGSQLSSDLVTCAGCGATASKVGATISDWMKDASGSTWTRCPDCAGKREHVAATWTADEGPVRGIALGGLAPDQPPARPKRLLLLGEDFDALEGQAIVDAIAVRLTVIAELRRPAVALGTAVAADFAWPKGAGPGGRAAMFSPSEYARQLEREIAVLRERLDRHGEPFK